MPRARAPRGGAAPAANPPPAEPEVASGLAAVRAHGGRDEELYLSSELGAFEETFMTGRILTSEESARMVKKVELLVRQSREYKAWVSHLRGDLGMGRCSVMPNADASAGEVGLEMHHCPLSLFEICDMVLSHRTARGQLVTSMTVADEVLAAHARGWVGAVPLLSSLHKLAHAGHLVVHPAQVAGNWLELLRAYPDGVTEELVAKLARFCRVTEEDMQPGLARLGAGPPRLRPGARAPAPEEVEVLLLPRGGA